VRVETLHFFAIVVTLGQQTPSSSAASDNAIKINFRLGESRCCHAQFIATMLTDGGLVPPLSWDAQVVAVSRRQGKDHSRQP
tara:strand:- start:717 stop:962 length:246 start_codon:yes stop_codon:yes gene_type:complete